MVPIFPLLILGTDRERESLRSLLKVFSFSPLGIDLNLIGSFRHVGSTSNYFQQARWCLHWTRKSTFSRC